MPKKQRNDDLSDEDYQLLRDNGVAVQRSKHGAWRRRLRRERSTSSERSAGKRPRAAALTDDVDFDQEMDASSTDEDHDHDDDDDSLSHLPRIVKPRTRTSAQHKIHKELFGDGNDIKGYEPAGRYFAEDETSEDEPSTVAQDSAVVEDTNQTEGMLDIVSGQRLFRTLDERRQDLEDVPATLQAHFSKRHRTTDRDELREESQWIYTRFFKADKHFTEFEEAEVVEKIERFLSYVHLELKDIPFIACYFRVRLEPELIGPEPEGYQDDSGEWQILWEILELDILWCKIWSWRQVAVSQMQAEPPGLIWSMDEIGEIREVSLNLSTATGTKILEEYMEHWSNIKRDTPKKAAFEGHVQRLATGFRSFIESFCLTSKEFGENLAAGWHNNSVKDPDHPPEDALHVWCERISYGNYPNKSIWERQAQRKDWSDFAGWLIQREMSLQPAVVTYILDRMRVDAVISCEATEKGLDEASSSDQEKIFGTKNRSVTSLNGNYDYLLFQDAAEKKWCKVQLSLPTKALDYIIGQFENYYVTEADVPSKDEWNSIRRNMLRASVEIMIERCYAVLAEEFVIDATRSLKRAVNRGASELLFQGRYMHSSLNHIPRVLAMSLTSPEDEQELVGSLVYGRGKRATHRLLPGAGALSLCLSLIDEFGNPMLPPQRFQASFLRQKVSPDMAVLPEELQNFLGHTLDMQKPEVIVIGIGSGGNFSLRITDYLKKYLLRRTRKGHAKSFVGEVDMNDTGAMEQVIAEKIVLVDDGPVHMWADTDISKVLLPDCRVIERRSIALGRFAQEPLGIYAAIGGCKDTVLRIMCHLDQRLLDDEARRNCFRRALIRSIAIAGLDVNLTQKALWRRPMLQFVGGFGRWKASLFYDRLGQRGILQERKLLASIWGKFMLASASGFLCITDGKLVLESTAIHPDYYLVAMQVACNLLSKQFGRHWCEDATRKIMADRSRLDHLDLNVYVEYFEKQEQEEHEIPLGWRLRFIFAEWQSPYRDPRRRLVDPCERKLFDIVTRGAVCDLNVDDEVSMSDAKYSEPGKPVWGTVLGVGAVIPAQHYNKLIQKGSPPHVHCKIIAFNFFGMFLVLEPLKELSAEDRADLEVSRASVRLLTEDENRSDKDKDSLERLRNFENIDEHMAKYRLRSQPAGYFIVHPSASQKQDHYLISMKMETSISGPVLLIEVAGHSGRYSIANEQFLFCTATSLLTDFVDRLKVRLDEVRRNPKYVKGGRTEGDTFCTAERQRRIKAEGERTYITSCFILQPRGVDLVYLAGAKTTKSEEITVFPNGFGMRGVLHEDLEELISWWKLNFSRLYSSVNERERHATPLMTPRPFDMGMATPNHAGQVPEHLRPIVAPRPGELRPQKKVLPTRSPYLIQAGIDVPSSPDEEGVGMDQPDECESTDNITSPNGNSRSRLSLRRPISPVTYARDAASPHPDWEPPENFVAEVPERTRTKKKVKPRVLPRRRRSGKNPPALSHGTPLHVAPREDPPPALQKNSTIVWASRNKTSVRPQPPALRADNSGLEPRDRCPPPALRKSTSGRPQWREFSHVAENQSLAEQKAELGITYSPQSRYDSGVPSSPELDAYEQSFSGYRLVNSSSFDDNEVSRYPYDIPLSGTPRADRARSISSPHSEGRKSVRQRDYQSPLPPPPGDTGGAEPQPPPRTMPSENKPLVRLGGNTRSRDGSAPGGRHLPNMKGNQRSWAMSPRSGRSPGPFSPPPVGNDYTTALLEEPGTPPESPAQGTQGPDVIWGGRPDFEQNDGERRGQ